MAARLPDPERTRRTVGLVLFILGNLIGASLLLLVFFVPPLMEHDPMRHYQAMGAGAALAFPAVLVYMVVPRMLDRYDPEPWWALAGVFVWGALAACGFAATINTLVAELVGGGENVGGAISAITSAPIVEEFFKGLALFGMFYFLRREFDGVVDGIIYATFVALGFAAVENVVYYAKASMDAHNENVLAGTFILRGIVTPWAHPLFTSMTGLGFGVSRESTKTFTRWIAPLGGYAFAVFLHAIWNGVAVFSTASQIPLVVLVLPLWLLFVVAFIGLVVSLVVRRGRIIRQYLQDEVVIGTLSPDELSLVCSPFGQLKASMSFRGSIGREFVATASRLALSKWHATRAMQGQMHTVSFDFIGPLRQRLAELRAEMRGYVPPPQNYRQPIPQTRPGNPWQNGWGPPPRR